MSAKNESKYRDALKHLNEIESKLSRMVAAIDNDELMSVFIDWQEARTDCNLLHLDELSDLIIGTGGTMDMANESQNIRLSVLIEIYRKWSVAEDHAEFDEYLMGSINEA